MRAAILAIGDEITLGQALDTNSAWLAEQLLAQSVVTDEHRTVPDDRAAIAEAIAALTGGRDVLITTGGLGPTEDDLTRDALADVLAPGSDLVEDAEAAASVRRWYAGRPGSMPASNLRQALRPETMHVVPNPHGTAPGLAGTHRDCLVFALPGPPREMKPMFREHVAPALAVDGARERVVTETVHMYGAGESWAAERLGTMTARDGAGPTVGTTASHGIVTARVRASGDAAVVADVVARIADRVETAWEPYGFGRGGTTLAEAVGAALRARAGSLVTAESCTGGWLAKAIVDVPGASDYYRGGWVTYANDLKTSCLGVPPELIAAHGAVSAPVAAAMAEGGRHTGEAAYGLAVTGLAGPGGEGPGKPAGTVFIGLARPGVPPLVRRFRFRGERSVVRDRAVKSALQMLRFALLGVPDDQPLIGAAEPRDVASPPGARA